MPHSDTGERITPVLDFPSRDGLVVQAIRVDYEPGGFTRGTHRHPAGASLAWCSPCGTAAQSSTSCRSWWSTAWAPPTRGRSSARRATADRRAERLYREAIDRLGRTGMRLALARARLLYGEWLRRERRRPDARDELRSAHETFTTMGAEAFAACAEREVRATGANARKRTVEISDGCRSRSSSPAPRRNVHVRVASDGDGLGHLST